MFLLFLLRFLLVLFFFIVDFCSRAKEVSHVSLGPESIDALSISRPQCNGVCDFFSFGSRAPGGLLMPPDGTRDKKTIRSVFVVIVSILGEQSYPRLQPERRGFGH